MSADLIAWLRAQLDAREADARRRLADHTQYGPTELDPDDLLAEVDAKRAILDRYEFITGHGPARDSTRAMDMTTGAEAALLDVIKLLAQPYAGRDGWQEEWRIGPAE